ncbi:MAG: hypothetical protein IJ586_05280 [Alloprevotella sp.]|nr:hypothetical protein [Alloprevotella sp.]
MKTKVTFLLLTFAFVCCAFASAQKMKMKIKGTRPTITDFVNFEFQDAEDEFYGLISDAWEKFKRKQPLSKEETIVLDSKNGYMRYERNDERHTTVEMCYWNCADKKHKLLAVNAYSFEDGRVCLGQFDGISFRLYDNARRTQEPIAAEDIGLDLYKGMDEGQEIGYDADKKMFYIKNEDDAVRYMTQEEMNYWEANVRPLNIYHLPRKGTDFVTSTYRGTSHTDVTWQWDGTSFSMKK